MNNLKKVLMEAIQSVLPIFAIVLLLSVTAAPMESGVLVMFLFGTLLLIIGMGFFTIGSGISMEPLGEGIGATLGKTKRWVIPLLICFGLGLLITIAEPDLTVLAEQVPSIPNMVLIWSVGIGVGIFLVISVIRTRKGIKLNTLLLIFYGLIIALAFFAPDDFIPTAFDSGGVTTGPITVPFIMAFGAGIASMSKAKNARENSFGLIALCSVGPMLAVLILSCTTSGTMDFNESYEMKNTFSDILHVFGETSGEVALALGLIVVFFFVLQFICLKLPKSKLVQIGIGLAYTFAGLVIFLSAVKVGFMPIGYKLGIELAKNEVFVVIFAFVIGMVVVLAEPAVHVLNKQVEDITEGSVSRKSMMIALCIGVGLSIGLSILRIVLGFNLLYYLIPGYLISLGLSFFVPGLYTAIAFDSGGVASGPLTSSFILPFAVGVCFAVNGSSTDSVLTDAFGIVAMVAMAPLITIQLLGFKSVVTQHVQKKMAMDRILASDDEQIIDFM